jgi:hypothetical protein
MGFNEKHFLGSYRTYVAEKKAVKTENQKKTKLKKFH